MQAAIITGKHEVRLRDFPEPEAAPGAVVVDIRYCGICGTDVHAYQSGRPYPMAACGHEWAGSVREVGAGVTRVEVGDRVTVAILPPCGSCVECRAGHAEACPAQMRSIIADPLGSAHGGYAPSIAVSADRVALVPDALSDEAAAQVEPATVAYHGVRRSHLRLGDVVVVQGAGPIGLFTLQWVRAAGASRVVVIEKSPARAEVAGALGADAVAAPGEEAAAIVLDHSGGLGADVVFECAGLPETIQSAVDLARRGGAIAIIGLADRDATIRPGSWLNRELAVSSSLGYHHAEFARCMAMMADGRVMADRMHTRTVGLADIGAAIGDLAAGAPDDVKILVDPRR